MNGKAGMGKTFNMSGLAKADEYLRNMGVKPKINFTGNKKAAKKTVRKKK